MKHLLKFLDVPNYELIRTKLCDYLETRTNILNNSKFTNPLNLKEVYKYVPELKEYLDSLGLEMTFLSIIQTVPGSFFDGGVHVDVGDAIYGARFIWPIMNCEGSSTIFYDIPKEDMEFTQVPDGYHAIIPVVKPPYKEITRYELNAPAAINTRVPHGVFCNPSNPGRRWSASMTFTVPPNHLLED